MSGEIISSHDSFDFITDHSRALYCIADLIDAVDHDKLNDGAIYCLPDLLRIIGSGIGGSVENARKNLGFEKQ